MKIKCTWLKQKTTIWKVEGNMWMYALRKCDRKKQKQMKRWLTTELQDTSSLMRTMTSCVKVPGHRTWDTSPLAQASWAVNFLPLSSISLACSDRREKKESESKKAMRKYTCVTSFFVHYYWRSSSFIRHFKLIFLCLKLWYSLKIVS